MRPENRRYWYVAIRSLIVLFLLTAFVSAVRTPAASADGPMGNNGNHGNWSRNGESNWWQNGNQNRNFNWANNCNCGHWNWNWNNCNCNNNWNWWNWNRCNCNNFNNFGWNWPIIQPITYPVYTPVYIPAPTPVYTQPYATTVTTQPVSVQTLSSYGPGWNNGLSQADIQAVCHQYNVALQYRTMSDNPALDQVCGTTGGSTSWGTTSSSSPYPSSSSSYPSSGSSGSSYNPYP